jgi:SAM-dependent methyltransferase
MATMSNSGPRADGDATQWADPAPTYDTVAHSYAKQFLHELDDKPFDRELLTRFAATVAPLADAAHPVCDIGCGPGQVGAFVADQGLTVMGIDLSTGMVEEARRVFPHMTFEQGDMTALSLGDGSLAGIVCFYALIHIHRSLVPLALGQMHRVLIPEGQLLVAVHGGRGSLHATAMANEPADLDATLFELDELTHFVEAAGLDIVEAHQRDPYEDEHPTPRLYVWARRAS